MTTQPDTSSERPEGVTDTHSGPDGGAERDPRVEVVAKWLRSWAGWRGEPNDHDRAGAMRILADLDANPPACQDCAEYEAELAQMVQAVSWPNAAPGWTDVMHLQAAYTNILDDLERLERQRDRAIWHVSQPGVNASALRAAVRGAFLSDPADDALAVRGAAETGTFRFAADDRGYRQTMPRPQHHCTCGQPATAADIERVEGALADIGHQLRTINRKQTRIMTALTDLKTELTGVFADLAAKITRLQASVDNPTSETRFSPEDQVAFDEIKATVDAARATVGDEDGSDTPPVDPTEPVL